MKKLALTKETLITLNEDQFGDQAHGGYSYGSTGYNFCQTNPKSVCVCTIGHTRPLPM